MQKLVGIVGLSVVMVFAACDRADDPEVGSDEPSIQGGKEDPRHPWAVGIYWNQGGLCSGSLIAPNLVLTARHCVAASPASILCDGTEVFGATRPASEFIVTTRSEVTLGPHNYDVKSIVVPKDTTFCGNDIALVVLDSNVPAAEAKPIVPAVSNPISDHSLYGSRITAIGFGLTAPASTGAHDSNKRRIRQQIPIRCIPGDTTLPCSPELFGSVHEREFLTAYGVCSGDSGSGAYEQKSFDRDEPVALGVLSRGYNDETTCLEATYTRTDSFKDLIVSTAVKAAGLGAYPLPAWAMTDGGPPDGGFEEEDDAGSDGGKKPVKDAGIDATTTRPDEVDEAPVAPPAAPPPAQPVGGQVASPPPAVVPPPPAQASSCTVSPSGGAEGLAGGAGSPSSLALAFGFALLSLGARRRSRT